MLTRRSTHKLVKRSRKNHNQLDLQDFKIENIKIYTESFHCTMANRELTTKLTVFSELTIFPETELWSLENIQVVTTIEIIRMVQEIQQLFCNV